ncbi:MAG: hypothetical protein HZR80_19020 [Candidatus Heimdallarchaeota archaeon]
MDKKILNKLSRINWEFPKENTQYLTHSFHQYPARFIPQIPKVLIENLTKKEDTVLDPFCGCGTTLVESQLNERNAIGIDLNPLACLISKVKTTPLDEQKLVDLWKSLKVEINNEIMKSKNSSLVSFLNQKMDYDDRNKINLEIVLPNRRKSAKFTEEITKEILIIRDTINDISDKEFRDFLNIGLSATIYSCFDSRSKKFDFWRTFERRIEHMSNLIINYNNSQLTKTSYKPEVRIFNDDARRYPEEISRESVDLVITSPTYVNVFDYYRIHIYNLIFLELEYENFRQKEMGAHRRHKENRFRLLTEYLADMYRAIQEMNKATKTNGHICIIIGDSCIEFERIHTHKHFITLGKSLGLNHLRTITRNIDPVSKYANRAIGNIEREHVLVFKTTDQKRDLTKKLMISKINSILEEYEKHIKTSKGTCVRKNVMLTKERLLLNQEKIRKAIDKIPSDINR